MICPTTPRARRRAFSLPEVTISIGIVAAVVLPTLALLASGARLSQVSIDQEAAARLASDVSARVRPAPEGGGFEFAREGKADPLALDGGESWYAAFSADGAFLRVVGPGEYSEGLGREPAATHLAALKLEPVAPAAAASPLQVSLYRLEIKIESPAAAALRNRGAATFTTRLAGP